MSTSTLKLRMYDHLRYVSGFILYVQSAVRGDLFTYTNNAVIGASLVAVIHSRRG